MIYPFDDVRLFLKYAIPCGNVLVERGDLGRKKLERLKGDLLTGRKTEEDLEKIFPIAARYLTLMAKRAGKKSIDSGLVRKYFWKEHKKCIEWRMKIYPDVVPEMCMVVAGRVISSGKNAIVRTSLGNKTVRTDFCPGLKPDDLVAVHYDYAVEKLTAKQACYLNGVAKYSHEA